MKKENYDITLEQGATFARKFTFTGSGQYGLHSLEGWTARLHVRRDNADGPLDLDCNLDNGRLEIIDASKGQLLWKLEPEDTRAIKFPKNEYELALVYSLELTDSEGEVHKVLRANFMLHREITR